MDNSQDPKPFLYAEKGFGGWFSTGPYAVLKEEIEEGSEIDSSTAIVLMLQRIDTRLERIYDKLNQ